MFIVTNREIDESKHDLMAFGTSVNHLGPNELRLAEARRVGKQWRIDVLPDTISDAMANEVSLPRESDAVTGTLLPIPASRYVARKLLARLRPPGGAPAKERNLVFFVHGFNNDVKAILDRAEKLEKTYGVEVLTFSWPANGGGLRGVASYKSDKRDALASTGALDRCFSCLADYLDEIHREHVERIEEEATRRFPNDAEKWDRFFTTQSTRWCPLSVNLLTHSMGAYLLKHLLKSSVYRWNNLVFDNILLVASDTNSDNHPQWVDQLQCRNRIFITINEHDSALRASRMKMGEQQKARLGHYPYGLTARRAVYVNFTGQAKVGDSHAYFEGAPADNPRIKHFFGDALNGRSAEEGLKYDASRNMHEWT